MTVEEASASIGVGKTALYNAIREGRLPSQRVFGRVVVRREDVEAYRARTQPEGKPPRGRPRKQKSPGLE